MKNVLKIFGIPVLVIFIGVYIYFLKFLPQAIDLNAYIPEIQKIVKENSGLDVTIGGIKLVTTPVLGIGAKIDDISVNLPDKSNLLELSGLKAKISLPNLIFLNVRISDITLYKPVINLEIENGKEFKAIKAVEGLLLENEKKQSLPAVKNEGFNILSLVTITVPSVKILDYKAYVSDLLSGEYLLLEGDLAKLGYFNGKRAKVQTQAELYLNSKKQLDIDINLDSFIPKTAELDNEDDPAVRAEVPFMNPVLTYKSYDPKGSISAKIKLSEKDIHGFFNLENLTLDIEGYKIPKSYARAKFFGNKIITDSDIFLAPDSHLKISGKIKNLKKPDV
ncbi:MAG: hypothetical protein LUE64_01430, partial [Candidatus Gastranaerophilales bacterium]|nr:hypothetical protein [Candidatus Gastranaerophilales bacterium]